MYTYLYIVGPAARDVNYGTTESVILNVLIILIKSIYPKNLSPSNFPSTKSLSQ